MQASASSGEWLRRLEGAWKRASRDMQKPRLENRALREHAMLCNSCDRDSLAARRGGVPYVTAPSPERPHLVGGRRTIWRFCVRRLLALEAFLGGGARELAVLHAAKTQKLVCQFVDALAVTLESENL